MPFLTEVHFENYRSFVDAKCRLSPVTLVIGANNAGKSNFLRGLADLNDYANSPCRTEAEPMEDVAVLAHRTQSRTAGISAVIARDGTGSKVDFEQHRLLEPVPHVSMTWGMSSEKTVRLYALDEKAIVVGGDEASPPEVMPDGSGTIRVLEMLSREQPEVFMTVCEEFRKFLPEVEQLVIKHNTVDKLHAVVKEAGIEATEKLCNISPGARTVLALLAIIRQPNRPELILLEDIEHAIHPRGLAPLIETMRRITKEHGVQFIMTTQSPYVLDCFQKPEFWDDVVIVEKHDGVSTLTNAKDRLVALGYEREMDKVPLGDLWYSGLIGGVANPPPIWDKTP